MTAPIATVGEADIDTAAVAVADLKRQITQHFEKLLTGYHQINGHFIKITTDINKEDEITLELTRRRFDGDDCAVRVTLTLSDPEDTPPAPVPDTIDPRSAALLEIWAPGPSDQPRDAA